MCIDSSLFHIALGLNICMIVLALVESPELLKNLNTTIQSYLIMPSTALCCTFFSYTTIIISRENCVYRIH